jgi:hypothetical protein
MRAINVLEASKKPVEELAKKTVKSQPGEQGSTL